MSKALLKYSSMKSVEAKRTPHIDRNKGGTLVLNEFTPVSEEYKKAKRPQIPPFDISYFSTNANNNTEVNTLTLKVKSAPTRPLSDDYPSMATGHCCGDDQTRGDGSCPDSACKWNCPK